MNLEDYHNKIDNKVINGEYDEAISLCNQVMLKFPNDMYLYYSRGYAKSELGDYNNGIDDLDKCIELDNNYAFAYAARGLSYYHLSEYNKALDDFNKALEIEPNYFHIYSHRAKAKVGIEDYKGALDDYELAFSKGYEYDVNDYWHIAFCNEELGFYYEAIKNYKNTIKLEPYDADNYSCLSRAFIKVNDTDNAIRCLKDADKKIPNNFEIQIAMAQYYEDLKNYSEAQVYFQRAIMIKPDNPKGIDCLATHYSNTKDYDNMIKYAKMAIEKIGNEPSYYIYIILALMEKNEYDEAKKYIDEVIKLFPDDCYVQAQVGLYYYDIKDYVKALDYIEKAIYVLPKEKTLYRWKLDCLKALDRTDEIVKVQDIIDKFELSDKIVIKRNFGNLEDEVYYHRMNNIIAFRK